MTFKLCVGSVSGLLLLLSAMTRVRLYLTRAHFVRLLETCAKSERGSSFTEQELERLWDMKSEEFALLDGFRVTFNEDCGDQQSMFRLDLS